jgi:hypothetical protein
MQSVAANSVLQPHHFAIESADATLADCALDPDDDDNPPA